MSPRRGAVLAASSPRPGSPAPNASYASGVMTIISSNSTIPTGSPSAGPTGRIRSAAAAWRGPSAADAPAGPPPRLGGSERFPGAQPPRSSPASTPGMERRHRRSGSRLRAAVSLAASPPARLTLPCRDSNRLRGEGCVGTKTEQKVQILISDHPQIIGDAASSGGPVFCFGWETSLPPQRCRGASNR